ncbi:lytic transglycosylase domain-containing protein [Solibacillus sp. CAU 1738]|uniref:lytic transglycosylase domain-containing protein n=1 Tax=Solibacillus sp. CAU 1738 TaxID=3140363 RepID=UPI0032619C94
MDIQSIKTLMELQALQTISGTNSNSASPSVFSSMVDDLLQSELTDATKNAASLLNSYSSMASADSLAISPKNYLDAFLLEGQANTTIDQYLNDYTGQSGYENVLAGASSYSETIAQAANTYNVPEKLIAAIIKQESNFNPNAVSTAGATGLMQLMPSTAKFLGVTDPTNPEQNIMGGAKYLRQMLNQFDNDIEKALAAYNAGPGNVKKYDGIPPFNETTNYVKKVLNYYRT